MKNGIQISLLLSLVALLFGCATVAQSEFATLEDGQKVRIGGEFKPMKGWNGQVRITINGAEVIRKNMPVFSGNSTEIVGEWEGREVVVHLVRIKSLVSSYVRGDVTIDGERVGTLTF